MLILLGVFIDPRKNDWPQRALFRNVVRFAGARLEVRRSPGFDPSRTCFPDVQSRELVRSLRAVQLHPAILSRARTRVALPHSGLWLAHEAFRQRARCRMAGGPADLKRMWRLTRAALDSGVSLLVFPEGGRTLTGRVDEFQEGPFRMALQFGTPIVPVSIVGSFEFNRKTSWMLRPAKIVVHLHDVIETAGLDKRDAAKLSERVHEIIAAPVNAHIAHLARAHADSPRGGGQPAPATREASR